MWQEMEGNEGKGRVVGHKRAVYGNIREDLVISHLLIGHTALNQSLNIIGKHVQASVAHVESQRQRSMFAYIRYNNDRKMLEKQIKSLGINGLPLLKETLQVFNVSLDFLKATNLIKRI